MKIGALKETFDGEARVAIFEWIEGWYNPRRRHSGLGYLSPHEYEALHTTPLTAA